MWFRRFINVVLLKRRQRQRTVFCATPVDPKKHTYIKLRISRVWLNAPRLTHTATNEICSSSFFSPLPLPFDSPAMVASLEHHSPWGLAPGASTPRHQATEYVAWHIRTSDGETAKSYHGQKYVIQEASSDVCPTFLVAMDDALQRAKSCRESLSVHADNALVFISSNRCVTYL